MMNAASSNVGRSGLIVPAGFEPTPEENSLLALYGKVRLYEKERDKIKEQAAKAKLRAKDEQFRRENEGMNRTGDDEFPSSSNKKKRTRSNSGAGDEMDYDAASGQDSDHDSVVDSGDDRDEENSSDNMQAAEYKARRRKEKLKKLRQSVKEEKERGEVKQQALEEQERQRHLMDGGNVLVDDGLPVLRKKAPQYGSISESLLSSVKAQSTPPHEFSKKLVLPRIGHYGKSFPTSFLHVVFLLKYTSHFLFL